MPKPTSTIARASPRRQTSSSYHSNGRSLKSFFKSQLIARKKSSRKSGGAKTSSLKEKIATALEIQEPNDRALALLHILETVENVEATEELSASTLKLSFSKVTYETIAAKLLNIQSAKPYEGWGRLEIEDVRLPARVQAEIGNRVCEAICSVHTATEAGRVNWTAPIHQHLCSLFCGALYDTAEATMIGTDVSGGGRVEREIKIAAKTNVQFGEFKLDIDDADAVAQIMCELYSGAHMNRLLGFPTIKVRGYLTDLETFIFVEYDPSTGTFSHTLPLRLHRDASVQDTLAHFLMIANKIFSLLLKSFQECIFIYTSNSRHRLDEERYGSHERSQLPLSKPLEAPPMERLRESHEGWKESATEIHRAFFLAKSAAVSLVDSWSEESLRHLEEAVRAFPSHDMNRLFPSEVRDVIIPGVLKEHVGSANEQPFPQLPPVPEALLMQDIRGPHAIRTFDAIIWLKDNVYPVKVHSLPFQISKFEVYIEEMDPKLQTQCHEYAKIRKLEPRFFQFYDPKRKVWRDWLEGANICVVPDYGYRLFLKNAEVKVPDGWVGWEHNIKY